jgi:sentrin-specific protease 1
MSTQPELLVEHNDLIDNALINSPQDEVLVNMFSIPICRKDIQTLYDLNWLNDQIINFYMSLLCERSKDQKRSPKKVYAMNTFFYPKLLNEGYSKLKNWTKKVDIFSFDLVLVPLHLGMHWTLAVIDIKGSEVRYYDSMSGKNNECFKALRLGFAT